MFITPAFAQSPAGGGGADILLQMLPLFLVFAVVYFLILRPQQQKQKKHMEMVKNVRRGDTVIMSGGLVGKVTKVIDDSEIQIELSEGVKARAIKSMIADVRAKGEPVANDA